MAQPQSFLQHHRALPNIELERAPAREIRGFFTTASEKFFSRRTIPNTTNNDHITLHNIPLEAYEYVVNGKSVLDWVVERQCVKTDKKSGIVNDANDWAIETMANAKYPLELFMRVITVSLETMKIVKGLPGLEIGYFFIFPRTNQALKHGEGQHAWRCFSYFEHRSKPIHNQKGFHMCTQRQGVRLLL